MSTFIVYHSITGDRQVLVLTPDLEKSFIKDWSSLVGRDIEEFSRWECKDAMSIISNGFGDLRLDVIDPSLL